MNREELRQAILSASDTIIRPVPTPEWPTVNGQVHVRTMTLPERTQYLAYVRALAQSVEHVKDAQDMAGVRLVVLTMCDSEGTVLMEIADIEPLAKKSWLAMNRVVDESASINGLTKQSLELAKNGLPSVVISASN